MGWKQFKRNTSGAPSLGEREHLTLELLWQNGEQSAQKTHRDSLSFGEVSINTLQSTLERLYRKKLVNRRKVGRLYLYSSVSTKTEFIGSLLDDITRDIAGGDMQFMVSAFMGLIEREHNEQTLVAVDSFDRLLPLPKKSTE